jgi:hypothetical protein
MDSFGLTTLVRKICEGTYASAELIHFINLIQKAALSYLRYQEVSGKRIATSRQDNLEELEDLATDCVADLFMRDEDGLFIQLRKYFGEKLADGEVDDAEMMLQLRRLVVKKTKQELSRIFRERDPEGAKIVRNIKVAVRTSDDLACFKEMGREFVCFSKYGGNGLDTTTLGKDERIRLRCHCPPYPDELLESRFFSIHNPNDSVSTSIKKLLKEVQETEGHKNFLSIEVIARMIRCVRNEMFRENVGCDSTDTTPMEYLQLKEINEAKEQVLTIIEKKIQNTYLSGGKPKRKRAEIYKDALIDVLDDLVHHRKSDSYFHLLRNRIPGLTQQQYRNEERTVFEYLAKVVKKEFRKKLKLLL